VHRGLFALMIAVMLAVIGYGLHRGWFAIGRAEINSDQEQSDSTGTTVSEKASRDAAKLNNRVTGTSSRVSGPAQ